MKTELFALAAISTAFAALSTTQAATIAYVGVNTNIDSTADDGATSGWNSSGNAKSLDIDGDNILGTHGWTVTYGSGGGGLNGRKALPASLTTTSATTPNANIAASQVRDSPSAGVLTGNPATEAAIGSWWRNNTASATQSAISFTVADASAYSGNILRLGILFDSQPGNLTGSQTFTLAQTTGGAATATSTTLSFAADGLDAAYFDLTSLTTGDVFQLSFTNTTGSFGHLSGITFDVAPIPEPSAALLGGLGFLALLRRRR